MKTSLAIATLALALLQTCGAARAATLASELKGRDGWVAYRVPMVADAGQPCCFEWSGKHANRAGCDLDGRNWNFGTSDDARGIAPSDALAVYVRVEHGSVATVRALSATCPVRSGSEIQWLDDVAPGESVALLEPIVAAGRKGDDTRGNALAALAFHDDKGATAALARLAAPGRPRDQREQALFWLGQARGVAGAEMVERVATTDEDPELRAQAVFALSQSKAGDPYLRIKAISSSDRSEHVRSQALFWMAQMHDPRAEADITARVRGESSSEVREQAVFALSQLGKERADNALIGIIEGDYPRDAKERALFWLGQSGSDKALEYFDRLLAADPKKR